MTVAGALLGVLAVATSGCTDIPLGGDPVVAATTDTDLVGRIAVAPIVTITLADSERPKQWKPEEVFVREDDPGQVRLSIEKALAKTGCFSSPIREAASDDPADAWTQRDDLVLSVAIRNVRIVFEKNGWYYWNMANFIFNVWPAWIVAKEDYTLAFEGALTVRSGSSGRVLLDDDIVPVSVKGSFDEFDRGFQFFGCLAPSLDADNWRLVASKLLPAARRQLAEGIAKEMDAPLRKVLAQTAELQRKRLLVSVGISRYADSTRYPLLAFGASDAAAVTSAFQTDGLLLPQHATVVTDDRATRASVDAAMDELFARADDGDTSVFYFAGYGTRTPNGEPALALYDSSSPAEVLPLKTLADHLARGKGQKLMILDCSFDQGRAVRGGPTPAAVKDELAALAKPSLRIMTACGTGETALEQDYLRSGLFTHELIEGLSGRSDANRDGRVTIEELSGWVREQVITESSYRGETQTPRLAGGGSIAFEIKHGLPQ